MPPHFLAGDASWQYIQVTMGFRAHVIMVHKESGERRLLPIQAQHDCRESVIHNARQILYKTLCQKVKIGPESWHWSYQRLHGVDLHDPETKQEGLSHLYIAKCILHPSCMATNVTDEAVEKFLLATDAVLGPMCVLLAPNRLEGEWWRTTPENCNYKPSATDFLRWFGTDNFFLQHPVLIAIVLGLLRQVALICRAGHADRILGTVDRKEVEDCLSSGDSGKARAIIRRTREFIEVPPPAENALNFPFPLGYWKRMHRLQIGARRHGYEKLLGQDFYAGWSLEKSGHDEWTGVYSFWGSKGDSREEELMRLGKPRSKQRGDKSATS